jgi:hypothetical protein
VVTSCEEVRALLADFVCSRLAPEQRRQVEQHRQTCSDCGEIVADLEMMKKQIQASGEAMFEPHPEPAALHRFVLEGDGKDAEQIRRHLESCASCQLEVETWKRIGRKTAPAAATPARGKTSAPWLSLAAGLGGLIGLLIGWRLWSASVPVRPETTPPRAALPAPNPPQVLTAPVIHVLPGLLRSGEVPPQHWSIDADEPYLAVTVPLSLPAEAAGVDLFRFELRPVGREPVWKMEMPAARIREHLESAEAVNLSIAPEGKLAPGRYELRVVRTDAPEAPPLYRAEIEIDYRQSPAATNAPQ